MSEKNKHWKKISITVPAELPFSPKVREFLTTFLKKESEFSNKWVWRLWLMVDEMVNNAIEHWSNSENDSVEISLISYTNKSIEIRIKDSGKKWKTISWKDLMKKINLKRKNKNNWMKLDTGIRWRWLSHIVSEWSDKFDYTDNKSGWLTWIIYKEYNKDCSKEEDKKIKSKKRVIQIETIQF